MVHVDLIRMNHDVALFILPTTKETIDNPSTRPLPAWSYKISQKLIHSILQQTPMSVLKKHYQLLVSHEFECSLASKSKDQLFHVHSFFSFYFH